MTKRQSFLRNREALSFCIYVVAIIFNKSKTRGSEMLQVFNYNAGRGDCIRLRYIGISGVLHNILIDSGVSRFGLEFKSICQKILSDYEKIDVVLITHVSDTQGDRHH